MALTTDEVGIIGALHQRLNRRRALDEKYRNYVMLRQRVEQLGMAVPQEMRRFMVALDWPRVVVDTLRARQQHRAMILPGEDEADAVLESIALANNLSAALKRWRGDYYTFGRGYLSVGMTPEGRASIRVESPRQMEAEVDPYTETISAAVRFYGADRMRGGAPRYLTLYTPHYTKWCSWGRSGWVEDRADMHGMGKTPIVMHLNRQWAGEFEGQSELVGIIPLTDGFIRSLTNMQFAQEAHGVPSIWATGVTRGDFVDENNEPLSQFETYYDVVKTLTDPAAKWGQFVAADLKNFETAQRVYGTQASVITGFPARYFGLTSANPATEGAVIADEIQLVRTVEDRNESEGVTLGWAMALAYEYETGRGVEGNRIRVEYHNPATPTLAQREDALAKRRAAGVLSREGYWDELGWSEARKAKERAYLAAEAAEGDPYLTRLAERVAVPAEA